jgi:hypothetical protein
MKEGALCPTFLLVMPLLLLAATGVMMGAVAMVLSSSTNLIDRNS